MGYYSGKLMKIQEIVQTSYSNPGGKGDRLSIITATSNAFYAGYPVTRMIDGTLGIAASWSTKATLNNWLLFDFGTSKVINEVKWYQGGGSNGVWRWQGSNNNIDFTNIGEPFELTAESIVLITTISDNQTAYRYYKMIGVSGNTNANYFLKEIEFKISL